MNNWGKAGLFAGGVLFGTAGIKILGSRGARKAYAHTAAAAIRARDCVMTAATRIREGADDIMADARKINEDYAAGEEIIEDSCCAEKAASAEPAAEDAAAE